MHRSSLFGEIFGIGVDILHAGVTAMTKVVLVQLGDSTGQQPDSDGAELWQAPGLLSIPAAPTPGGASCQGIIIKGDDRDRVIACRDTRAAPISADMAPGDTSIFGTGTACNANNGRVVTRADGSIEIRSTTKIDVGGNSTDHAALASKVDNINANMKSLAQALGAVAVNPSTGDVSGASWAAVVTAAEALASSVSSVASNLVGLT